MGQIRLICYILAAHHETYITLFSVPRSRRTWYSFTIEILTGSTIIKNYCHYLRYTWFTPPGTLNTSRPRWPWKLKPKEKIYQSSLFWPCSDLWQHQVSKRSMTSKVASKAPEEYRAQKGKRAIRARPKKTCTNLNRPPLFEESNWGGGGLIYWGLLITDDMWSVIKDYATPTIDI